MLDKYKGERLIYSSDRIYGIDISKYQHVIKGKKYNIDWKRLRISHLGNISKKQLMGMLIIRLVSSILKVLKGQVY